MIRRATCYSLAPQFPACLDAQVAQLVEQRTENPRVGGSIPSLGTSHPLPATRIPVDIGTMMDTLRLAANHGGGLSA